MVGVVLVSFVLACGGTQAANAPPPDTRPPDPPGTTVDKAAAMFLELGEVVMAAKSDCNAMAASVGAWLDRNGKRRERVNGALMGITSDELETRYRTHLNARLDVVVGMKAGLDGCKAHAGFASVWKRLDR